MYDEWDSLFHAELYMKSLEADWDERDTSKVEEDITVNSIGQYIDSLIDKLPVSRREIFLLSRKEHLSTKEIAQRLSISERTLKPRFTLSQFLRKYFGGRRDLDFGSYLLLLMNIKCEKKRFACK